MWNCSRNFLSCSERFSEAERLEMSHGAAAALSDSFQNLKPCWSPTGTTLPRLPVARRWLYLWAAVLASTTPAECIQERTASGSSFMLVVAPRGRLSWIPNISGAQTLNNWLYSTAAKSKDAGKRRSKQRARKKSSKLQQTYRTDGGWSCSVNMLLTNMDREKKEKVEV